MSVDEKSVGPTPGGGFSNQEGPGQRIPDGGTEDRLRESEKKYRLLVETTGTGYVILDEKGNVIDANEEYVRITGRRNPAEVIGHSVLEWTAPYHRERNAAEVRRCIAEGYVRNLEIDYITTDGRVIPLEINASVLSDRGPLRILSLCRDISERRRAEEASRQREEQLRLLAENMVDAISRVDTGRKVVYASPSVEWVFGIKPEDLVGEIAYDRVHPEDAEPLRARTLAAIAGRDSSLQAEYRYLNGRGDYVWVESAIRLLYGADGNYAGAIISSRDISKRKRTEDALRQANRVVENSPLVVFRWRAATGWPVDMVSRNVVQFGYTPEELLSGAVPFAALVHPDDLERVVREVQEYSAGGVERFRQEYRMVTKDGTVRWVDDRTLVGRDETGQITHYEGIVIDINNRKQAEEALRLSEITYREIFNTGNDAIWIHDLATHKFTDVNKRVEEMFGYSVQEALDLTVGDISSGVPPFVQETALAFLQKAAAGEPQLFEWHCRHKSGRLFWSEVSLKRGTIAGKECILAIERDISERKRAEQERAQLADILAASLNELYLFDARSYRFVYLNEGALRNLGYTLEQAQALTPVDIIPEFTEGSFAALVEPLRQRRKPQLVFETWHRRADGSVYPVEVHLQLFEGETDSVFLAVIQDITERRQAEAALRASEALYHDLVETSQDLIWQCDAGGRYTYLNPAWELVLGYRLDEMLGRPFTDFQAPEQARRDRELFGRLLAGESVKGHESFHLRKDGQEVCLVFNAKLVRGPDLGPAGTRGTAYDISERKKAEAALRESEERFAVFMSHLPAAAFIKDVRGHTVFANRFLQELFQFRDWQGKSTTELIPGEFAEKMLEDDRRALQGLVEVQESIVDAQGNPRVFQTWKFPIRLPGSPVMLGGISVDITERKQAEEDLRASLEEKTALLQEVHHRVKNNLQIISSLLHLQFRKIKNEEMRSVLQDAENRVRSMALLHEILYRSGELARIRFPEYVQSLCVHLARTQGSDGRGVRLRTTIADEALDLDQAVTAGLIINELVSNAFKHAFPSPAGGEIRVELQAVDRDRLLLRVADDGRGIPAGITPQDSRTLGLLLVENLCRQLGGTLSVKSPPGTVIEVVFPKKNVQRT